VFCKQLMERLLGKDHNGWRPCVMNSGFTIQKKKEKKQDLQMDREGWKGCKIILGQFLSRRDKMRVGLKEGKVVRAFPH